MFLPVGRSGAAALFLVALSGVGLSQQKVQSDPVIARFLAQQETPVTSYRAVRRMEAQNGRFGVEAWMEAMTELSPATGLTYNITGEGGSGFVRNKVMRAALKTEAKMIADGVPGRSAWTLENYSFSLSAEPSQDGLVMIIAKPRRKDSLLIDGAIFIEADSGELVRVDGQLSKGPSFWTRDVHVTRRYGRIGGVRVPLSVESTSNVRVAGASRLTMAFHYESVNGQAVDAATATP